MDRRTAKRQARTAKAGAEQRARPALAQADTATDAASRLLELIELTYSAVDEPDNWRTLLRRIISIFPGVAVSLYIRPRNKWDAVFGVEEGYPHGAIEDYLAEHDSTSPWNLAEIRSAVGVPYGSGDFVPVTEIEKTEFYKSWCVPYGLGAGFGVKLFDDADSFGSMIVDCSPRLAPIINQDVRHVLRVLAPHIRQALRLSMTLRRIRQSAISDIVMIEKVPALVVDADMFVLAANEPAERLRETGWLKWPAGGGTLGLRSTEDSNRLRSVLQAMLIDDGDAHARIKALPIADSRGEDLAVMDVTPLRSEILRDGQDGGFMEPVCRPCFLARLRRRSDLPVPSPVKLESAFGLTDLEAQAVVALIKGQSIEQQAKARGVTTDAVRWHFRNIYQKLGCKSQVELASLVFGLTGR